LAVTVDDPLLNQWRWLCTQPLSLIARTGFGDLFLRTVEAKVLCLNLGDGTLGGGCGIGVEFSGILKTSAKREHWFGEQQLEAFAARGLEPNDLQCIGFKVPVVFAESADVPNNGYPADLDEQVSFLGDLHRQIADAPDGEKIRLRFVSLAPSFSCRNIALSLTIPSSQA
jgi:hypothetical protein